MTWRSLSDYDLKKGREESYTGIVVNVAWLPKMYDRELAPQVLPMRGKMASMEAQIARYVN